MLRARLNWIKSPLPNDPDQAKHPPQPALQGDAARYPANAGAPIAPYHVSGQSLACGRFDPPGHWTGHNIGNCLATTLTFGLPAETCDFDLGDRSASSAQAAALMDRLQDTHAVVRLEGIICNEGSCAASVDGTFIYRDNGHLSKEGSAFVGRTHDLISLGERALVK